MKVLIASIYYQLLSSMRIKQAVFFTVIFPAFIFLIFSSIWGINNKEYCVFLLTGICAMTIASDGLFAIGGVIKQYYTSGVMKFIKSNALQHHYSYYQFGIQPDDLHPVFFCNTVYIR